MDDGSPPEVNEKTRRVCLNMIVKNEARVIARCLASVRDRVDAWVIVDTGSIDGTQDIIRRELADLPGELHERPWVDFAHNRTEALRLAAGKGDYLLIIDADEVLEIQPGTVFPALVQDAYLIEIFSEGLSFWRPQLIDNRLPWSYYDEIHEFLICAKPFSTEFLHGFRMNSFRDGARASDPGVYERDAEILERALQREPDNPRYTLYLADTLLAANRPGDAAEHYLRRTEMGGWIDEVWWAAYRHALSLAASSPEAKPAIRRAYQRAVEIKPDRAEPLYRLALMDRLKGNFESAREYLERAHAIPFPPPGSLFVEPRVYHHLIPMGLATCWYNLNRIEAAVELNESLLRREDLPEHLRTQINHNLATCLRRLQVPPRAKREAISIKIFIPLEHPNISPDNCLASLLIQEHERFKAVLYSGPATHDGEGEDRLPDDPRFLRIRESEPRTTEERLRHFFRHHCAPDDVFVYLDGADWLEAADALALIAYHFADADCEILTGCFRYADGPVGPEEAGSELKNPVVRIFRARLFQEAYPDELSPIPVPPGSDWIEPIQREASRSGIHHTRRALYVYNQEKLRPALRRPAPPNPGGSVAVAPGALPTISCLMVTRNRFVLMQESVRCYLRQTYPARELVIAAEGDAFYRRATADFVRSLQRDDIRLEFVDPGTTLAAARNITLDLARGELFCQWDDDDLNHPERLSMQANCLFSRRAQASFLTEQLQFFWKQREMFWVDWTNQWARNEDEVTKDMVIPGTIMMYAGGPYRYPETGPGTRSGEDSVLVERIYPDLRIAPLRRAGYLYVYVYHGSNTFSGTHHKNIPRLCGLSADRLKDRRGLLTRALRDFRLPAPFPVYSREGEKIFIYHG